MTVPARTLNVDADGPLVLLALDFDEAVVACVRCLPDVHYRRKERRWVMPARAVNVAALAQTLADVSELGVAVHVSDEAAERLRRTQIATVTVRDRTIRIHGPYSESRVNVMRALADARFDSATKTWSMPLHCAEAIAVTGIIARGEAVSGPRAAAHLQRVAAARPAAHRTDGGGVGRSPEAHWRYHLPGNRVFDAGNLPRINDPVRGWCVRVRVNPRPRDSS